VRSLLLAVFLVVSGAGCSGSDEGPSGNPSFGVPELVPAPAHLLARCLRTADAVGYPVPCPTRVPAGLLATQSVGGCRLEIIGPGGIGACSHSWRGWVVGSSETNDQHLVLVASQRPLDDPAKVVNGPAWYPGARVRLLSGITIKGRPMRAFYVSPDTNEGSSFAHHVVLIWTVGDHTYGVGFHDVAGVRAAFALDVALARAIRLVRPRRPE
jgi:hypothetical protein